MAYDSNQGLYYNFYVNNLELDFNPSYVSNLTLTHSIFNLFPTVSFSVSNTNNALYQQGLFNSKNIYKIELGDSQTDENIEIFKDLYLEHIHLYNMKSSLSGALDVVLIHKSAQLLILSSLAKAWSLVPTSTVIQEIMSTYFASTDLDIETTSTIGTWLKPSNQSQRAFLKILKNRSLSSLSSPSKMFMWIDLFGKFHFKSLNSLLIQAPVGQLDFTNGETEYYIPTDFDYMDNGIRYKDVDVNNAYQEYLFNNTGNGALLPLTPPTIDKIDGLTAVGVREIDQISTTQPILYNYNHSKLSPKFNLARYINESYNFPFRLSFKIKNIPYIQPGKIIQLIFPYYDTSQRLIDPSLSGKYLITEVKKLETRSIYNIEVSVVSNSQLQSITPLR